MKNNVKVGKSKKLKGIRGIIANNDIPANSLIDSCEIILIPNREVKHIDKTILTHYIYEWDENNWCFVVGNCVLTNHSYQPNARYKMNFKTKKMDYFSLVKIKKNEEILVNYNGEPQNTDPIDPAYTDYKR